MILSMTGYGDAECSHDRLSLALEIRSVNNRYFKATIKLPEWVQMFEPDVEKLLRSKLARGSINFQLRIRSSSGWSPIEINRSALESYVEQLQSLPAADNTVVDLAALLNLPGVCNAPEMDDDTRTQLWGVVQRMALEAVDKLIAMRREEGRALAEDLLRHTGGVRRMAQDIAQRAPVVVKEYQTRLKKRVDQLLEGTQIELEHDDLVREVAIFAERCDISEELVRLNSHLDQFETLCRSDEDAGRKLNFVTQEMLREVNTVGSKANDADIAKAVVEMKGLVDRLREQVQNVE